LICSASVKMQGNPSVVKRRSFQRVTNSIDMRVKTTTNYLFDDTDPDCALYVRETCGQKFAFIECLDLGRDGEFRFRKRLWGPFAWESAEAHILKILERGCEWPDLPGDEV